MGHLHCMHCGKILGPRDSYFEVQGGAACLKCVAEHEIPLKLPRERNGLAAMTWPQQRLERHLDNCLGQRPLLSPPEISLKF